MSEPLVAAICLTRDRPLMLRRAVESFRAQTYPNKRLYILDTSERAQTEALGTHDYAHIPDWAGTKIGTLRNLVIEACDCDPDIIVTFDDDDVSSPNRIAEQVALLQSSGADAVGYSELLFWRTCGCDEPGSLVEGMCDGHHGEAWLYRKPKLVPPPGTTLCYWRRTWERKLFPDAPRGPQATGEDYLWCQGLNVVCPPTGIEINPQGQALREPMIIASIHSANSSKAYDIENKIAGGSREWTRVEAWDNFCRERMWLEVAA